MEHGEVKTPIFLWLMKDIPESLAMAALMMHMADCKSNALVIVKVGIVYAAAEVIAGSVPFTPGVHVIVLSMVLGILAIILGGLEMKTALILAAAACSILILADYVLYSLLIGFELFTLEQLLAETRLQIVFSYPHTVLILALTYILRKKEVNLIRVFKR